MKRTPIPKGKPNKGAKAANSQNNSRAEHLTGYQFQPGQSGNPNGRPKKTIVDEAAKELLAMVAQTGDRSRAEQLVESLFMRALNGDMRAAQILIERAEGKPIQAVKMDGNLNLTDAECDRRLAEIVSRAMGDTADAR